MGPQLATPMRLALRRLLKSPGFTLLAVLTLAIGVGANTAVFSVVHAVLLQPLPYPEADRILLLRERSSAFESGSVSFPNYQDWREGSQSFSEMALYRREQLNVARLVTAGGPAPEPERLSGCRATGNFIPLVGLRPQLGRSFSAEEDTPAGPRAAIISESLWQRLFDGSPEAIGQQLVVNGIQRTVVGVMPATMQVPSRVEIYIPLGELRAQRNTLNRGAHGGYSALGRLKPGATMAQAAAELDVIAAALEKKYPETNSHRRVRVYTLFSAVVDSYKQSLWLLLGAVGAVLLIACANVANLQLARAAGRGRELAVCSALGAGRGRLMRELFTESLLLGLLGGATGALVAWWSLSAIRAVSPDTVRFQAVEMNWIAFAFAAGIALLAAVLAGAWPAWRASGDASLASPMQEGDARGASGGPRRTRAQSVLVVTQVALALILLTGASLLIQSLRRAMDAPLGFRADNLLLVQLSLPSARYPEAALRAQFSSTLLDRIQALPGVMSVGLGDNVPFDDNSNDSYFHVTGTPPDTLGKEPDAEICFANGNYFRTLGIPLVRGRLFGPQDHPKSTRVIIIDDTLAAKYFPGVDPIGRQIDDFVNGEKEPLTIVGVVGRVRTDAPGDATESMKLPQIYVSYEQEPTNWLNLVIKTAPGVDANQLTASLRREVRALDTAQPITNKGLMSDLVGRSLAPQRLVGSLLGIFSALALALSALGLYGVLALMVTGRTREFGIRLALGAQTQSVLGLVLRQGLALVGIGLGVGLVASLFLGRYVGSLLYGVSAYDVPTLLGVTVLLVSAGLGACWLPARRATKVDPATALRAD